ncbi:MAG TPA: hypothetical protein DF712_02870 [Balneola sp.]|nr:hypothetical protein [Balneola sp.]|tara:strand:- start:256 stop:1152 length:897 start_codon:yes stop_codon:yes gene_type:complete
MHNEEKIDLFSIWTLTKAGEAEGDKAPIGGVISSDAEDLQGDRVLQEGCDWSYFLKRGWFNYEHKSGAENIVGIPEAVEPVSLGEGKQGTKVKGYLLLKRPKAKEVYEAASAIQQAGNGRSIGFSVEGQVLERDSANPKIVTKARILNVSVTAHPVNPDARLEVLARSLQAGELDINGSTYEHINEIKDLSDMNKGKVGYNKPSKSDPDANLSPLLEESLDKDMAEEEESPDELKESMLRKVIREELSSNLVPFDKKMVSSKQMTNLLSKVFPEMATDERDELAKKFIQAAKTYNYSK